MSFLESWIVFLYLTLSTIINIVVPISGSAVVTTFLAVLTDPHRAIGLASFFFLLSGIIRVTFFYKYINWDEIKNLLPISLLSAVAGTYVLVYVDDVTLYIIILAFSIYFLLKKLNLIKSVKKEVSKIESTGTGLLSGLLQGAGLAGSDIRNAYLLSRGLSLQELHATTAFIGSSIFFVSTIVRLFTNQITIPDLTPLIFLIPFIVIGTLVGKKIVIKMSKKIQNIIIVSVMIMVNIAILIKILFSSGIL